MNTRVLFQCKNNKGKLGVATVTHALGEFKETFNDLKDSPYNKPKGFFLIGGEGITQSAKECCGEFNQWCKERNLDFRYYTKKEFIAIRDELRNRVDLKDILENKC